MAELKEIKVPDIGDFDEVDVIEVLVNSGDSVDAEDSLITLETDKATMEVPCPEGGIVQEVLVSVGDKVSEGSSVIKLDAAGSGGGGGDSAEASSSADAGGSPEPSADQQPAAASGGGDNAGGGGVHDIPVPDIGDFDEVDVIEVLVKPGDTVQVEDPLITLETDKASMEVPSPHAGTIKEVLTEVGGKVSEGTIIARLETGGSGGGEAAAPPTAASGGEGQPKSSPTPATSGRQPDEPSAGMSLEMDHEPIQQDIDPERQKLAHASPSIRKFARELGVDLGKVTGSGPKGRILKEDVQAFVKRAMEAGAGEQATAPASGAAPAAGGSGIPPIPPQDFSKFGEIEEKPLSRIKQKSGPHLHRSWVNVPHVTQFDQADITEMENFRQAQKDAAAQEGVKLTPLAFMVKAAAAALTQFPDFNSSLNADGDSLVIKKYINIGVAVDTPNGLVVPVLKDPDQKGIYGIARDLGDISTKARDGKLGSADMQGGTFSISSLGGLGGTAFTPIVNAPEVAILGVSKSSTQPVWNGKEFEPRLMLPLSLSYDHRVIDGAAAARFTSYLGGVLSDLRRLVL